MPKFYCEYCGIYLTHSSPSGRKQHSLGKKHISAREDYYRAVMSDLVDQLKASFQKNIIPTFISKDTIKRLLITHSSVFQGLLTPAFVETIDSLGLSGTRTQYMPQPTLILPPQGPYQPMPYNMMPPGMQMRY
ncbi:unnamed protein product [Paramecium sonneborni]|uniref:Matrin-type domain-containing protein n=1 Tax=Paramecium sonneborni TaxID=65129 RepID=A0A8S1NA56_9CILI|nr:unnamed protein product [Paramecium sonneborni]